MLEIIKPLEFNNYEPLIGTTPFSIDKQVILNDTPNTPVKSTSNEQKPLMMVQYVPSSFGVGVSMVQPVKN